MCAQLQSLAVLIFSLTANITAAEPAVRGTVTDEQGRPQAEVLVLAIGRGVSANGSWSTRTDAQGQFEFKEPFPADQRLYFNALKHGWYADTVLVIPQTAPPATMAFVLRPAQTRTVSILDADGKHCPAATVVQLSYSPGPAQYVSLSDLGQDFAFPVDANGKVAVDILPPGDARLFITVESSATGRQSCMLGSTNAETSMRLKPVGSLAGRLIAPDGFSASGIELRISTHDGEVPDGAASAVTTVTDEQGKFSITKLAVGKARILPQIDPSRPVRMPSARIAAAPTVEIFAGQEAHIEVELQKAVRVTGTVLSRDDNQPIAGAKVVPWDAPIRAVVQPEALTDKEGRYTLFFDSPNVRVRVEDSPPPFYTSVGRRLMLGARPGAARDDIELPAMYLSRGVDHKGIVVDENGKPAAGAWVTATWPEATDGFFGRAPVRTSRDSRTARTDAEGRFTLERVSATADLLVRAATDDRASIVYTPAAAGDNGLIRLTVVPDAIMPVSGRVVNREGNPIAGASIELHELDGWTSGMNRPAYDHKREWRLITDASGHYETRIPTHIDAPGVAGGSTRYTVYARSPTGAGTGHFVEVGGAEAQIEVPDFVLPPMRLGK